MAKSVNRLVFLDRDGVLNVDRPDSVKSPDELVLLPGAAAAVARLNAAGWTVVVVTNQGLVGRGVISVERLDLIHDRLRDLLAREGGRLDEIVVCVDHPDRPSERRKPAPGMLVETLRRYRAVAAETTMIGDDRDDLEAARAAGCRRMLVRTGKGAATQAAGIGRDLLPVSIHADAAAAIDVLLGVERA